MPRYDDHAAVKQGLAFFGRSTAGVTHEIKNCLALINEFNGLIGDLVLAHEKGHPLNLARIKSLVADVKRQVAAGGEISGNLNRLAHSADEPWARVDLGAHLRLFAALAQRQVQRLGASLEVASEGPALMVRTRPFLLLLACQQGLEALVRQTPGRGRYTLSLSGAPGAAWIGFSAEPAAPEGPDGEPAFDPELLDLLGAQARPPSRGLALGLPRPQEQ